MDDALPHAGEPQGIGLAPLRELYGEDVSLPEATACEPGGHLLRGRDKCGEIDARLPEHESGLARVLRGDCGESLP